MLARVALLCSLGLATLAAAHPLRARNTTTCYSGVYMIVARGSEEAAGEGKPGDVASLVAAQIPNSGSIAVNYPASIADPPYPESVVDGINNAISEIQAYVNACGASSRVALIGYSQGGNIMTDMLAGGVDKPTPIGSPYTDAVTAVTVFGDPTFTVGQSFNVGNATSSGIFSRGGSSLALLNTYGSKIQSYCMADDPVCASGDELSVHTEEVETWESAAASFIVSANS